MSGRETDESSSPGDRQRPGFQGLDEIGCGVSTSLARYGKIATHDHVLEFPILKVALSGVALALCLTGCPLKGLGGDEEPDGDATAAIAPGDDAAEVRAECVPEGSVCNGVDDDCDGVTDEGCELRLGGHVLGAGVISVTDGGLAQVGAVATRHFIGTSSDGDWVIRGGLPPAGEVP